MRIVITITSGQRYAEISYNSDRKPETIIEQYNDIEIDEQKLFEALDIAKEAIKEK